LTVLDLLNIAREDGWQSGVDIKKNGWNAPLGFMQVTTRRATLGHW